MIPVVIYTNTDFKDIFQIQNDYYIDYSNKYLIINNNNLFGNCVYKNYNYIYFYEEHQSYAKRLFDAIKSMPFEYFLFTHENDICISANWEVLDKFIFLMKHYNIDRINLQANGGNGNAGGNECIEIENDEHPINWKHHNLGYDSQNILLTLHNTKGTYQYNVNPAIWKRDSFLKLLKDNLSSTYRTIEYDVENYIQQFKIYNFNQKYSLNSGYQRCTSLYKYLHITHYGKLLRFDSTKCNEYGQSYSDLYNDYEIIVKNYNLKNSHRQFS